MNCLEVRRRLMIDPSRPDRETRQHLSACAACAHESDRLLRLDEAMRLALLVEPAPGLESRILLAQTLRRRPARGGRGVIAIAAVLLLSLVIATSPLWGPGSGAPVSEDSLAAVVLDHIQSELEHLEQVDEVPPQALSLMLAGFGARLRGDAGEVRYLGQCRIGETDGMHLVLEGEAGPVTVLLMPHEQALQVEAVDDARFQGLVVPTGQGTMAVVGEKGEPLGRMVERLSQAIVWKT